MADLRVAVVGGGIAGALAAFELAGHGDDVHVILLEQGAALGEQATGRSAAVLSETSGTRVMCALASASRAFLETPPAGFVEHALTTPRGLLWFGRVGDEPALDEIAAVAASGVAPTARRIDAEETRAVLPVLRPQATSGGGVWEPDARGLDVAGLLQAAARGAVARGAEIRLRTALDAGEARAGGGWRLATTLGPIDVDVVVNAAGAWGDVVARRCGVEPLGLQPLRRTACIVPMSQHAGADVSAWPLAMDAAARCYFEPETGGLLVSPADETPSEPVDARAEEEDVAWAIEMLHEATTLQVRSVRSTWAGLRTFAPDRAPVVGADPGAPGFVWLVGQGGAGIKTAPAMAEAVSSAVTAAPWPVRLTELGVGPDVLSPARLR